MNSEWLSAVANHLWQSTLVTAVAGLFVLMLRKQAAHVRYWIWFAASVKFLVPFSLLITLGTGVRWRSAPSISPASSIAVMVTEVTLPFAMPATPDRSQVAATAPTLVGLSMIVCAIWLVGVMAVLLLWAHSWLRMAKIVRRASHLASLEKCPAVVSPALLEPSVFGIFRPVLVLPQGIEQRLSHEQLEAVIAHEMCHISRRDNLLSSIHMVVAAIFWFYPVVWWVGMRLLDERERACDEQVLKQGSDPQAYAQGILQVCKSYLESPLRCASGVSGANLQRRINAIISGSVANKLSFPRVLLLAAAATAALVIPFAVGLVRASPFSQVGQQSSTTGPQRFEVVSVKPRDAASTAGLGGRGGGGGLTSCSGPPAQIDAKRMALNNTNLHTLITLAYGMGPCVFVHSERISGGPAWMKSDHFDVQAVLPDGTPQYTSKELDDGRASALETMLQNMLADRFKLAVHREMKEMPVYVLSVAKGGPKFQLLKQEGCLTIDPYNPPTTPPAPGMLICGGSRGIRGVGGSNVILDAVGIDLDQFAQFLGGFVLDRPVMNKTGITGIFEAHVRFASEGTVLPPLPPFPGPAVTEPAASIFTAMQEQLGLQLQSARGPVEAVVIDSVEKPSEN